MQFAVKSDKVCGFTGNGASNRIIVELNNPNLTTMTCTGSTEAQTTRAKYQFFMALVCVALMFFATLAQALDSHELGIAPATHTVSANIQANTAPGFCLVCVAAHSPSVIAQVNVVHFYTQSYVRSTSVAPNLLSLLLAFDFPVRPPPSI
jgi:hypothetical protein